MSLLIQTPCFSEQEARRLIQEFYGITGGMAPLPSYSDQNFLLHADTGERYVLKISNAGEEKASLDAQNQALAHLAEHGFSCPQVVRTLLGDSITSVQSPTGETHFVRLVSYLPGTPYGKIRRQTTNFYENLGEYLGRLDRAFASFDHPATRRDFQWDLANALGVVKEYGSFITDTKLRQLIDQFALDFENNVLPLLPKLRRGVIHNDANEYNVIVGGGDDLYTRNQQVVGIIDFGDMVYSFTVADLAIAIAYAVLDKPDPLATAALVVQSYHIENPLTEQEISAIFGLACMRLCISACITAQQASQRPDDEYLTISQGPIHNTLPKLAKIHPRFAEATFRQACGLTPLPRTETVIQWLKTDAQVAPILDVDLTTAPLVVFDLGISSPLLGADQTSMTESTLTPRLFSQMEAARVLVGIGQYDEARLLYTTPAFATGDRLTDEHRTIHLGIDLFAAPATPVYAPLDGQVYAFQDNQAPHPPGYGPVIILEHHTDDGTGTPFYTLYGHLNEASPKGLKNGQKITAGDKLGEIGTAEVNGGWTPHLHFQIIIDLLDLDCDFPGVCQASQREIWKAFSPDPNLILRIPEKQFPKPQPSKVETLAARQKLIGRSLSIGYNEPLKIMRGWKQYLFDETGRRYVDAYNNVPHVGHCHPRVVAAGREQMRVLNTNTRYLHDYLNQYAQKIIATLPEPLSVCFFVNSGSEANELALRLSRAYTRQKDMLVLESSYHGHTTSLIDISPYKHDGPGGSGAPPWVHTIPIPDTYRGPYKADDPQAGHKYAQHAKEAIEQMQKEGRGPAGFIAEICPSVAGQIFLPEGYLSQVYEHVRAAGGLCIADDVQTGYGRTGTNFYAFEDHGVVPDIVVLGKPIGNGHPIGVVITRPEIAAAFDNGMEFFCTFGGNTVSCAIGMAVLDVVLEKGLQDHALQVGNYLLEGLRIFEDSYPLVGDVRGSGLFLGVELVQHPESLEPAAAEATFIANRMRELGVLLGIDGPYHNVIKIRPPMPFSIADADLLLGAMGQILWEDFGK
ncbi:MAG: aminotransferase class III-fold pyridoxal phosphate-dependent enzyme [Anaerolineales bacterium]|nr:aminotransferase class III-fold pyridoxal phosphate-dependent enzyme [Anaerolineales bacterium]